MLINDASITGSLIVNASSSFQNIAVSGNILPGTNNVYNLGSADKYFKEIFVSTGSINFVDNTGIKTTITSVAGGGIQIGSVQITTSSISFVDSTGSVTQNIAQSSSAGSTSNYIPTASFNAYTQSISSSVASSITSSIATISSSVTTTITTLSSSVSASFNSSAATVTSLSSSLTSVNTTQNNRLSSIESATGSYSKLSGGNTFTGVQIISGSTFIAGDLIVQGSSSIQYISASSVSIGTNTINLNTNTPAVRFAGISIFDSGSNAQTASIFWDGLCNKFIYSNPSSVGYSGGMLISGPRNTGSMGDESGLTCNTLATSIGSDHISSSAIFHDPTTTCFYNSTTINSSGILTSTNLVGTICARNGVVSGSSQIDLTATTNYASGILTRLNTVGVFSGSAQVSLSGFTSTNLSEGTNLYYTDARVKTKLNAETVISGSGQVAIASTTGFGTYLNQTLLSSDSPTFAGLYLNAGKLYHSDNDRDAGSATYYPNAWTRGTRFSFATATSTGVSGNYAGVLHFHPWDGTTVSTGDASYQLAFGGTASNGSGTPMLRIRKGIDTTWNSWYDVLTTANYTSYSPSLTGGSASGTWGISISGNAATATSATSATNAYGARFQFDSYGTWAEGAAGGAAIVNDNGSYQALMIVGNTSAGGSRIVKVWDSLQAQGTIMATGDITAYYSDIRLKENLQPLKNAISKITTLTGYTYNTNALGKKLLNNEDVGDSKVGLIAQDLQKVLPEAVKLAPFDRDGKNNSKSGENYLTIQYEKVVPLLVEAIKEQQIKIDNLTIEVENLKKPKGL